VQARLQEALATAVELRQCQDGAEAAQEEDGQQGWAEEPDADVWRGRVASDAAKFASELLGAQTPNIRLRWVLKRAALYERVIIAQPRGLGGVRGCFTKRDEQTELQLQFHRQLLHQRRHQCQLRHRPLSEWRTGCLSPNAVRPEATRAASKRTDSTIRSPEAGEAAQLNKAWVSAYPGLARLGLRLHSCTAKLRVAKLHRPHVPVSTCDAPFGARLRADRRVTCGGGWGYGQRRCCGPSQGELTQELVRTWWRMAHRKGRRTGSVRTFQGSRRSAACWRRRLRWVPLRRLSRPRPPAAPP
jgi:hypothetical protein